MRAFKGQRKIAATPIDIFQAFKAPSLLAQWWGPKGFTSTFHTFEFKPNGKWSFVMHGPDGTDYPNENVFLEITEPSKVVIRHDCNPYFTATINIEDAGDGAIVTWRQDFDNEEVAMKMAAIVEPANMQVFDKLQALVTKDQTVT